ncbi:hypothetical protein ACJMK2_042960, partial [Sinanodonta woodiana]
NNYVIGYSMAASSSSTPNVFRLREQSRVELKRVMDSFPGRKDLVIDPKLMQQLDRIANVTFLKKECEVDKIFKLDPIQKAIVGYTKRLYLVRPKISNMKCIADQILHDKSYREERKYRIVMVPRKLHLCEMILEQEGVFGYCEIDEFHHDLVAVDSDIMSMEIPEYFRSFFLDGELSWIHTIATSIKNIQNLMGPIPNKYAIGRGAKMCFELLKKLEGDKLVEPDLSKSEIGHLILFDRDIDYVTPLCTQVTYEGLLDDIFGIKCGFIEFDIDISGKEQGAKILLSSKDMLYDDIRNRHFTNVFDLLKSKAKELQALSDKRHGLSSVTEMKDFVANDLKNLKQEKQILSYHIGACERIIEKKTKSDFEDYIQTEHSLLEGSSLRSCMGYIEDCINKQEKLIGTLRLMCLLSLTQDGIPARDYRNLKTWFLHSHGFEQMLTFYNMKKLGLFREQNPSFQSAKPLPKMATGIDPLAGNSNFKALRKRLNLVPSEDVDLKNPLDMSYVFSGAYSPLSCKLVEQCLSREGLEEITKTLIGGDRDTCTSEVKLKTVKVGKGQVKPGPSPAKAVLVYFLGGCTYSEIIALRFLGKKTGYTFLIATTAIINGHSLLESIVERPLIPNYNLP